MEDPFGDQHASATHILLLEMMHAAMHELFVEKIVETSMHSLWYSVLFS